MEHERNLADHLYLHGFTLRGAAGGCGRPFGPEVGPGSAPAEKPVAYLPVGRKRTCPVHSPGRSAQPDSGSEPNAGRAGSFGSPAGLSRSGRVEHESGPAGSAHRHPCRGRAPAEPAIAQLSAAAAAAPGLRQPPVHPCSDAENPKAEGLHPGVSRHHRHDDKRDPGRPCVQPGNAAGRRRGA